MTTEKKPTTLADLIAGGLLDEYASGPPPGMKTECTQIDRECAAQVECAVCGRTGGRLRQFHATTPRVFGYLAYAQCPCGHMTDF